MNLKDKGHPFYGADKAASEQLGYTETYELDASAADAEAPSADATLWNNCRVISADEGGIIKIDYTSDRTGETTTEVLVLVSGILRSVRNVTKLYQYYTGTTAGTAKSYNSSGTLTTNMIKLHR